MPTLFKLPRNHAEVFGFDRPVSISYLTRVVFDLWEYGDYPERNFFDPCDFLTKGTENLGKTMDEICHYAVGRLYPCIAYEYVDEKKKRAFREKYVREIEIGKTTGGCIPEHGMHREIHQDLIESVRKDGIKTPITICDFEGDRSVYEYRVCEGKHRIGAAMAVGMKTIPAFELVRAGGEDLKSGWKITVWEFADIIKRITQKCEEE